MPFAFNVFAQSLTVARLTPSWREISACDNLPAFNKRPPASRLSSICSRVKYDGFHVIPPIVSQSQLIRIIAHQFSPLVVMVVFLSKQMGYLPKDPNFHLQYKYS